ncbi:MAG: hypothetical protein KG029_10890 [Bacteroidetes bacterium]|nr:hypothetical protein [Bacteroidota bacterium]
MNIKSWHDLEASIAVISANVAASQAGNIHAYRPVAVELRKLLCDTRNKTDNSLIKRLWPDFNLFPLSGNQKIITENPVLYIPAQIIFNGRGGSKLSELFNEFTQPLDLSEWLEQKLFDNSTTIRSFIRSVADKEGAHSDPDYNEILGKTKSVALADETLTAKVILAIGCQVVKAVSLKIAVDHTNELGEYIAKEYKRICRGVALFYLSGFARNLSQGISITYLSASSAEAHFKGDPGKREVAMRLIQNYESSKFYILLLIDLNNEVWLYQLKLRIQT